MFVLIPSRLRALPGCWVLILFATLAVAAQQNTAPDANAAKKTRVVGTIKSIDGNTITMNTDAGAEVKVTLQATTRLLRLEPGQTDIKSATPIQSSDLQVGDRLLAGGTTSGDGSAVTATTAVVMKKSDVAAKQQSEREEWQKHGVGGVVKAVDPATGNITLSTGTLGAPNMLTVHASKDTILRRYAPDSWKMEDAKPGTLDQIKPGDQLNARGTKSEDGKELTAVEIVSGTFRSIAALVVATNAGDNSITVTDLATKRPVTLKVGPGSQMHQLPAMFAQRIAMRLKGGTPGASTQSGQGGAARTEGGGAGNAAAGGGRPGGSGGGSRSGSAPDFQQMLNRMPTVSLTDLTKGSAVVIVATEGTAQSPSTVINLLSGVEPILTAASPSEASTILSPWNLSSGAIGGTGDAP
jgi:uncharacterized membrane protein YgcG